MNRSITSSKALGTLTSTMYLATMDNVTDYGGKNNEAAGHDKSFLTVSVLQAVLYYVLTDKPLFDCFHLIYSILSFLYS